MLKVYSKNNCPQCVKLKTQLETWGVEYNTVNIDEDMDARNFVIEQGHRMVPVLYNDLENINVNNLTKEKLLEII
jgi:glutaredoxin-like protein NrdH